MPKVKILGDETGRGLHNTHGDGIEHFGYVDGRSQPLFLEEDIAEEPHTAARLGPGFPLGRVLVARQRPRRTRRSISAATSSSASSSRTCARFQAGREATWPTRSGSTGADRERAGAMIVGRFEDGTPLTRAGDRRRAPRAERLRLRQRRAGAKVPVPRRTSARPTRAAPAASSRSRASACTSWPAAARPTARAPTTSNADLPPSAPADRRRRAAVHGLQLRASPTSSSSRSSTWANNAGLPVRRPAARRASIR